MSAYANDEDGGKFERMHAAGLSQSAIEQMKSLPQQQPAGVNQYTPEKIEAMRRAGIPEAAIQQMIRARQAST